jgi:hypothetical protein
MPSRREPAASAPPAAPPKRALQQQPAVLARSLHLSKTSVARRSRVSVKIYAVSCLGDAVVFTNWVSRPPATPGRTANRASAPRCHRAPVIPGAMSCAGGPPTATTWSPMDSSSPGTNRPGPFFSRRPAPDAGGRARRSPHHLPLAAVISCGSIPMVLPRRTYIGSVVHASIASALYSPGQAVTSLQCEGTWPSR